MIDAISVVEKTKDYIVVKIPRQLMDELHLRGPKFTAADALRVLRAGLLEYKAKKTKKLLSLRALRHGN